MTGPVAFQVRSVKADNALVFREGLGADPALLVGQELLEHLRNGLGGLGRFHNRASGCVDG